MVLQGNTRLAPVRNIFPGLAFALALALVARRLHQLIVIGGHNVVSEVIIVIVIGFLVKSFLGMPPVLKEGISFCFKKLLRLAIIILGLSFSLTTVATASVSALAVIIICIVTALLLMFYLGKLLKLNRSLALLIGVGTAICGASAIVATAPAIEAGEEDITYSVATITLFGVLAIFAFPFIGIMLGLSEAHFGVWAGTAIHETAQVIAAGFIYGEEAGGIATMVKLTRVALLAPVILALGCWHLKFNNNKVKRINADWKTTFPWFILGFAALAIIRTVLDSLLAGSAYSQSWESLVSSSGVLAKFLIVVAMAGVGLITDFAQFRLIGFRPLLAGLVCSVFVAGLSAALILM